MADFTEITLESNTPSLILPSWTNLWDWLWLFVIITLRYFVLAGVFWWFSARRLKSEPQLFIGAWPSAKQQVQEMGWAVLSGLIFTAVALIWVELWKLGFVKVYFSVSRWDWIWFPISWVLLLFFHETYFYWTHRWLHLPWWYKKVHYVHHMSRNPSAWTSFSFHPVESLINALAVPLFTLMIPISAWVILAHLTLMTLTAITNHLGWEMLPKSFFKRGGHRWWISALHHGLHHQVVKKNFGLFFTFWDHWMKTESAQLDSLISKQFSSFPRTHKGTLVENVVTQVGQ